MKICSCEWNNFKRGNYPVWDEPQTSWENLLLPMKTSFPKHMFTWVQKTDLRITLATGMPFYEVTGWLYPQPAKYELGPITLTPSLFGKFFSLCYQGNYTWNHYKLQRTSGLLLPTFSTAPGPISELVLLLNWIRDQKKVRGPNKRAMSLLPGKSGYRWKKRSINFCIFKSIIKYLSYDVACSNLLLVFC